MFLLSACQSGSAGRATDAAKKGMAPPSYPLFSPLAALPLPHAGRAMQEGSWDRTGGNKDYVANIAPGQTVTILDCQGAGVIQRFWMTISSSAATNALSQAILRMYWDDEKEPSVECPLGSFFGVGFGQHLDYISLPLSETSGGYNCYWPMPFHRHARWTLENRSDTQINRFYYNIGYTAYGSVPDDMKTFHACWRRENPTDPHRNYTILEAEGDGTFVGAALFMQGINPGKKKLAFLEGDEMIYIDQPISNPPPPKDWQHPEPVPRINGTGTEDYFCSGWYFNKGPYSAPYHGCVLKDADKSRISAYRWHIEDAIPFHLNLRVTIEHGSGNSVEADYSSVAYFYQSGRHRPYPPLPQNPADLLPHTP
jgi:hypothetical protein